MGICNRAVVFLLSAVTLYGAAPVIENIEPRGAQQGTAFKLILQGSGLDADAEIETGLPGAVTPLTPPKEMGRQGRELPFLVELPEDARVDVYSIRIRSKDGLSNLVLFTVGALPDVAEQESLSKRDDPLNDSTASAEPVSAPVTVNGTLRSADRDVYRIQGRQGERLVFEVEARRAGSAIDPVLRLLDAGGAEVARNDNAPGLDVDSRIDFEFQKTADYYVMVHDARFSAQKASFYRLKIGDFTYAERLFPLGGKRGSNVDVTMFGGNLPEPVKVTADLNNLAATARSTSIAVPGKPGALPLRFAVGDEPETSEPQGDLKKLEPGTVINGRIEAKGQVDRYHLPVKPGENWRFETQASADLGTSALYGVVTLYDGKGVKLASAGDLKPKSLIYAVISSAGTGADPFLSMTIPDGLNELTITVEDLLGRGGPEFGYRLLAQKAPPDFELSLATPYLNIGQDGTAAATVVVKRRGYLGPVRITIPDLPDDILLQGGNVPPSAPDTEGGLQFRTAMLTLTPKPGAKPRAMSLAVYGEGVTAGGEVIRRRARGPGLITRVEGDNQDPYTAPWLNADLPAMVVPEAPAAIEILTPYYVRLILGMSHEVKWNFVARQPGIAPPLDVNPIIGFATFVKKGDTKKGAGNGSMTLVTTESAGFGTAIPHLPLKFDMVLAGETTVDGRKQVVYAPAITLEVVLGYNVDLPTQLTLQPGGTHVLAGRVSRDPGFDSPINIKVENLPSNVSCQPVEVTAENTEFEVTCQAESAAEPGQYDIELRASSQLQDAESKKYLPLRMAPIKAKLTIGAASAVARASR